MRLGYRVGWGNDKDLWAADSDGSDPVQITTSDGSVVTWSPDGARLAYHVWSGTDEGLWVVNADGGDRRRITTTDSWFEGWSPDSTRLRYRVWLVMMRVFGFRVQTGPTQSRSRTKARP